MFALMFAIINGDEGLGKSRGGINCLYTALEGSGSPLTS